MKNEVKVILPPEDPQNKKGGVFELMVRTIIDSHDYSVAGNINFTGLEIDLLAKHNIRKNESLYVECKAKDKPNSTEIKNFIFGVNHKKASHGYFVHTTELEHQAAGLKAEILESDIEDYKKVSFIGPEEIIQILVRAGFIKPHTFTLGSGKIITKKTLALTYFGKFYVYIIVEGVLPVSFACFDADEPEDSLDQSKIQRVKEALPELESLSYISAGPLRVQDQIKNKEIETISEVATGEAWYDYKPTNPQFFVGRDGLLKQAFDFLKSVSQKNTERRVFYLEGKSGWGKSSFIARIRDKARNGHNKNKYYVYAVDYRSALSNNFASIAFSKLIEKSIEDGFLPKRFRGKAKITSAYDILSSEEVKDIFQYLEKENKTLVLIFDQFEDAFRQGTLFSSFYKLLNDAHDAKTNFVVGFSWKSEINIPADHEAYYLWQQAKTHALEMKMPEFGPKDLRAVTKQLEQEISKTLPPDLKTKLIEISQGFPWLIKKLCIHVYEQYKAGTTLDVLLEEDMNIEALFMQDLEKTSAKESRMLHYIARRAYEGRQYDISETDDDSETIVKGLINQRLVIRSGSKYNIYWDIFRDYLVEGKVPEIGEIYLLRSQPAKTFQILALIQKYKKLSINQLEKIDKGRLVHGTYQNYFRMLRDLGIIFTDESETQKYDDDRNYQIKLDELQNLNEQKFKDFLHEKFKKYAPVLRLQKVAIGNKVHLDVAQDVVAATFRGRGFREDTVHTYTQLLATWLKYAEYRLEIEGILGRGKHGGSRNNDPANRYLINFPKTLSDYLYAYSQNVSSGVSDNRRKKIEFDLRMLNMAEKTSSGYSVSSQYKDAKREDLEQVLKENALKLTPIQKTLEYAEKVGDKFTAKNLMTEVPEIFAFSNSLEHKRKLSAVLRSWAIFISE